jgi:hypothetical protein
MAHCPPPAAAARRNASPDVGRAIPCVDHKHAPCVVTAKQGDELAQRGLTVARAYPGRLGLFDAVLDAANAVRGAITALSQTIIHLKAKNAGELLSQAQAVLKQNRALPLRSLGGSPQVVVGGTCLCVILTSESSQSWRS